MSRVSEMIMSHGRSQADRIRRSGDRWANTVQTVGEIVPRINAGRREDEDARSRAALRDSQMETERLQQTNARGEIDERGRKAMEEQEARLLAQRAQQIDGWLTSVASLPDPQSQQQAYLSGRESLVASGVISEEDYPRVYAGPGFIRGQMARLLPIKERFASLFPEPEKPQGLMNVPAGGAVYDPSSRQPVFENPREAAPQQPPSVGSFEDYVKRTHGDSPTPQQIVEARKAYNQADDRQTDPILHEIRAMTLANLQKQQGSMTPAQFSMASRLADDYTQQSKDYVTRLTSFESIKSAAQNPSAAGDLALIFGYMRMLDPGSTVREGEFANAQNAAGVPDQVRNMYNRAMSGERLNPTQRQDFVRQAGAQLEGARRAHQVVRSTFTDRAQRANLNPADVVMDYDSVIGGGAPPAPAQVQSPAPMQQPPARAGGAAPPGQPQVGSTVTFQGKRYRVVGIANGQLELEPAQ